MAILEEKLKQKQENPKPDILKDYYEMLTSYELKVKPLNIMEQI